MRPKKLGESVLLSVLLSLPFALSATGGIAGPGLLPLPTTANDFLQPGTQPETLDEAIFDSNDCRDCHGDYDLEVEPYGRWKGSMMAQSSRDPVFWACLAIANQDVNGVGEICLRCHTPSAWLGGRSDPPDGSALDPAQGDFDGVTCHVCHRLVDPVFDPDENPPVDEEVLAALPLVPGEPHTAQYIIDPIDRRRGPFVLFPGFPWHRWAQSPFHREAMLCANCHDVSNPALSRQEDGTYKLNELDTPHPTHDKQDEFPIERTFTEWKLSSFGQAEIDVDGRFGGNKPAVSTCQDCHLEDHTGEACKPGVGGTQRDDMPLHNFNGANSWVIAAVRTLYPDAETGLTDEIADAALARNVSMLERAGDLEVFLRDGQLVTRVINRTGHKLPTGYGEGRRMWLHVEFLDEVGQLLEDRGHYDAETATLTTDDTRVYESHQGLDDYMAEQTGLPAGESFHFVLNNTVYKDNRVPPRGFVNAVYDEHQTGVVDHVYADEQYWDDALFDLPQGTASVRVTLYHQTTSREYIEFLRDENRTNDRGQIAHDVWVEQGRSAPVPMSSVEVDVAVGACPQPIVYGLGNVASNGDRARLGWSGTPSVAAGDFVVELSGAVPGRATLLVGDGTASEPFEAGTRLVAAPRRVVSFTVAADGTASVPVPLAGHPGLAGREITVQVLFEDSVGGSRASLSDALHIDICP